SSGFANAYVGNGVNYSGAGAIRPGFAGQFGTYGLGVNGSTLSHYLGFAANGNGTISVTAASGGNPLRIGQRDDGVTQMAGEIAEILMYNDALSAGDQSNVVSYLSSKYGLAQVVISNRPPAVSLASPTN